MEVAYTCSDEKDAQNKEKKKKKEEEGGKERIKKNLHTYSLVLFIRSGKSLKSRAGRNPLSK